MSIVYGAMQSTVLLLLNEKNPQHKRDFSSVTLDLDCIKLCDKNNNKGRICVSDIFIMNRYAAKLFLHMYVFQHLLP